MCINYIISIDCASRYGVGLDLAGMLRPAPRLQQMLGPFEAQPKARVVRAQRRVTVGALIRPEEISAEALAHQEARETDQQLTEMWEVVRAAPTGWVVVVWS